MKQRSWLIPALALLKFILPFLFIHSSFELQRDEFLYYEQGQHLALGYLENPPLLSYLGWVSSLFGGAEFWIKFWPAFIGSLTLVITCLLTAELGGKWFAQLIAGAGIITGAFLRVHALFQPNILDIFFWTLSVYFLVRYLNTEKEKFVYAFIMTLALGFWSKYSVVFMAAALFAGLLLTPQRNVFRQPVLYKAIALGTFLILPNLWWQYQHRWPVFHHMRELQQTQLQFLSPLDFLKEQLLYLFPVVFIWMAGWVWLFRHWRFRALAWAYIFVIVLLLTGRGKSYYALGSYPMLLAAGGVAWETFSLNRRRLRIALPAIIVALTIPFIPLLLPFAGPQALAAFYRKTEFAKTGLLRWEDQRNHPLPQDFADMMGWKELTQKAERAYDSLPDATKKGVKIYCRNYGQAGALKFYGKDKDFRQKVFSDNGSFLLWIPERIHFQHLLFIGWKMPEKDDEVFNHFQHVNVIDSVSNLLSRQYGDKIIFFETIDSAGLRIAQEGLQQMKDEFER